MGGKKYYRKPEMTTGGTFRCFNCNRVLAHHLTGSVFTVIWECERCGTEITVTTKEPIPFAEAALGDLEKNAVPGSEPM